MPVCFKYTEAVHSVASMFQAFVEWHFEMDAYWGRKTTVPDSPKKRKHCKQQGQETWDGNRSKAGSSVFFSSLWPAQSAVSQRHPVSR